MAGDVTNDGERLIKDWQHANERLRRANSEVNSAECEVANSTNALGKWLVPGDAKEGEKFCVWYGDSLLQAEKFSNGDYRVTVRARGKSLVRA